MLTEATIKAAIRRAPGSGRTRITVKDPGPRGAGRLGLVVRPLATRVSAEWYAFYHRDGDSRLAKIGTYPEMTLAEARAKFSAEYAPTITAGAEPRNRYTRRLHRKDSDGATVRALFRAYVDDLKARGKDGAAYSAERMLLLRDNCAADAIGADRPACEVTAHDIVAPLAEIHAGGAASMADNVRAYIRAAFEFGLKSANDYTRQSSGATWGLKFNPAAAIPSDPASRRAGIRFLSPAELRAFWTWCEENEFRTPLCAALRLQAATGQRVKEIVRITAASYDAAEQILDWSKTKNGHPHSIPLPAQAIEVMRCLRPNRHGLFFPHRFRGDQPALYTGPHKVVSMYCAETGAREFTPRDLRRTWKTLAGKAGLSKEIRDRIQNHRRADVSSRHYDRWDYMPEKREAMARWSEFLADVLDGKVE